MQYKKKLFYFDDLIKEEVENIQLTTKTHKITVKGKTQKYIYADAYRIGQVFTNLLSNAFKYSPNTKKIIVNISVQKNNVVCDIQDFGIGVPKQYHKKIFNRFFRINNINPKQYPGVGLGLHIASEIIKKHKGEIFMNSDGEKKGSTFSFSLPVKKLK